MIDWQEIVLRLAMALFFGAIIGYDREASNKPAGLKTNSLVSLGAATFTLISLQFMHDAQLHHNTTLDPLRLVSGLVGGMGFLGAGAIIQGQGNVKGITTAAGIWIVGGIGAACGAGFYTIALLAMAFTLLVLIPMKYLQEYVVRPAHDLDNDDDCPQDPDGDSEDAKDNSS